jgi:quercetin dioxygenase-like cupin family protein
MKIKNTDNAPRLIPAEGVVMMLIGNGKKITLIKVILQPGAMIVDHNHPNEQIGTCIEGEGVLSSGDEKIQVYPGVTWTIPGGEMHRFEVFGEKEVQLIEAFSPPREDYRAMAR